MSEKNIAALDGVRGIAILLVMAFHFTLRHPTVTSGGRVVQAFFGLGWSGVDLFFVLSGFLITGILLRARGGEGYYRNFYMRRVLRIFPLYYGLLFLLFVVAPLVSPSTSPDLTALRDRQVWLWSYLSNLHVATEGGWVFHAEWIDINHLWSLAVEEHFYLVWPFLVAVLSSRALTRLCVVVIVSAPILRFCAIKLLHVKAITTFALTPFRMDDLAMGGLLAVQLGETGSAGVRALLARLALPAVVVGLVAVLPVVAYQRDTAQYSWPMQTLGFSGFELAYAGLVLVAAQAKPGDAAHRVLTWRWLTRAGKYSYGGYVWHQVLRGAVLERHLSIARFGPLPEGLRVVAYAAFAIALSFAAAVVSWHVFEKWFLRLKRFFEYEPAR